MSLNITIQIVIFMSSTQNSQLKEVKCFYENGNPSEHEFYQDNKLEGKRQEWFKNGDIRIEEFYERGIREGRRKTWYRNGQLQSQAFYRDGGVMEAISFGTKTE